ncbi:unnamed protein product [marine sediment metagenome]|uniref:Peptidase M15A C-terminal domain-containing protein n=1 Tax=marine sediment metagenome TaxID=412755 RepID=X0WM14_9ZZZZ
MKASDFRLIEYFSLKEVERTGANVPLVKFLTIFFLDKFRKAIKRRVYLLANGLNSGKHKSKKHPDGEAVDCYIKGKLIALTVFKAAIKAGFRGIGIYWNPYKKEYRFHFHINGDYQFWSAIRVRDKRGREKWKYGALIVDPKIKGAVR